MKLKLKNIVIAFIALVLAVFIIEVIWTLTFYIIKIAVIFIIAYMLYLFLDKVL